MEKTLDLSAAIERAQALPMPDRIIQRSVEAEWQKFRADICRVLGMRIIQGKITAENKARLSALRSEGNNLTSPGGIATVIHMRERPFGSRGAGKSVGAYKNTSTVTQREIASIIQILADVSGQTAESLEMMDIDVED